jgi:hypothetical protein
MDACFLDSMNLIVWLGLSQFLLLDYRKELTTKYKSNRAQSHPSKELTRLKDSRPFMDD